MGAFSNDMRAVAVELLSELGNPCVLSHIEKGPYDVNLGKSLTYIVDTPTFSAPVKKVSQDFGQLGINTNLDGFADNKVVVPWIGEPIDKAWLYNGFNIVSVEEVSTQGDVIMYTITVGEH